MVSIRSTSQWLGNLRSVLDNGRKHSVVVDMGETKGGQDTGPTALELSVMSWAGCITTIYALTASKMRRELEDLRCVLEAEKRERADKIESAKVTIEVESKESEEIMRKIWDRTLPNCPVGVAFEKSGVDVKYDLRLTSTG